MYSGPGTGCAVCQSVAAVNLCSTCNSGYNLLADSSCSNTGPETTYPLPDFKQDRIGGSDRCFILISSCQMFNK